MQDYRKLKVWKRARTHALEVRKATNAFPRSGYAAVKSQMTRAAESIAFNIVEGCGTRTDADFARFLDMSIKSAFELESQLTLTKDYGVLAHETWESLSKETIEVRKMTCGLRSKVLKSE
jgi:four helix bundle protein